MPDFEAEPLVDPHPALGWGKRAFDLAVSGALLLLLSPLLALVSVIILAGLGRPILFRQMRPGLHGRPFPILKFRTMSDRRGQDGDLLPDDRRLGRLGRMLRMTSLDELPELLNVLRGDMSLVGPRPLLMQYLPLYSNEQRRRHLVRPGLTGLAQVNGRNAISWHEKFVLDVRYVDEWSPLLDLRILAATFAKVIMRQGISHSDHATAPKFQGNGDDR